MVQISQPFPRLSAIVAMSTNRAIGVDNKLPWHISEDLKRFKALTMGHTIVMGYNTYVSLPKRPLPGRKNVVLTHRELEPADALQTFTSVQSLLTALGKSDDDEIFIIGGASIYKQLLPFVSKLYVTWVHAEIDADTFFPPLDLSLFKQVKASEIIKDEKSGYEYHFSDYVAIENGLLP